MAVMLTTERIIGHYIGHEPGPFIIALAGQHGNEPSGVLALEQLFELLDLEPSINPGFSFAGEILALRGNLPALEVGERCIDRDQNRLWLEERLSWPEEDPRLSSEDHQIRDLLKIIEIALEESQPHEIVLIDLHTTTASGGIFAIPSKDDRSRLLAAELAVPVIRGMLDGLQGTSLHYFVNGRYGERHFLSAITFESGQHDDPLSADRALAATLNLLRATGCVQPADVRTTHDELLREYGLNLPRHTELKYVHRIVPEDQFVMKPGYQNFDPVKEGEQLGEDRWGIVLAPISGYILMPLYQKTGEEGFFIVAEYDPGVAF